VLGKKTQTPLKATGVRYDRKGENVKEKTGKRRGYDDKDKYRGSIGTNDSMHVCNIR